ncbi:hypothetical protein HK096_006552 [Nowakowskiella sp. JEL0078]|nr:hypothetical protein HK096_006552 [Nowakowskiella sp. JEL0078]
MQPSASSASLVSYFSTFNRSKHQKSPYSPNSDDSPSTPAQSGIATRSFFSRTSTTTTPSKSNAATNIAGPWNNSSNSNVIFMRNQSSSSELIEPSHTQIQNFAPVTKKMEGHIFHEITKEIFEKTIESHDMTFHLAGSGTEQSREEDEDEEIDEDEKKCAIAVDSTEISHLCSLCREDLKIDDHNTVLRCQGCGMWVHNGCLSVIEGRPCPLIFNEKKIQKAFLKVFTSLFKSYRTYLNLPDKKRKVRFRELGQLKSPRNIQSASSLFAPDGEINGSNIEDPSMEEMDWTNDNWFRKEDFLYSMDKETRQYMNHIVETQAFAQFTLDRASRQSGLSMSGASNQQMTGADYDILFFDESIKAKLNRSRLKFTKETTPFLKDPSYDISATLTILTPNSEGITKGERFGAGQFPTKMDENFMIQPRSVESLVTASDYNMMRSHTYELITRTRMMASNNKRKQDVTKWMKAMRKHFQKMGNGQVVGIEFLTEEQRREMFEERLAQVSAEIDSHDAVFLGTLSIPELENALAKLQEQNIVLMKAADEEQLVESTDQEELQDILSRLFHVITIYQDCLTKKQLSTDLSSPHLRKLTGNQKDFEAISPTSIDLSTEKALEPISDIQLKPSKTTQSDHGNVYEQMIITQNPSTNIVIPKLSQLFNSPEVAFKETAPNLSTLDISLLEVSPSTFNKFDITLDKLEAEIISSLSNHKTDGNRESSNFLMVSIPPPSPKISLRNSSESIEFARISKNLPEMDINSARKKISDDKGKQRSWPEIYNEQNQDSNKIDVKTSKDFDLKLVESVKKETIAS